MSDPASTTPSAEELREQRIDRSVRTSAAETAGDFTRDAERSREVREENAELTAMQAENARDTAEDTARESERRAKKAEIVRPPDEVGVKVERVLEENLWDVYVGLTAPQRSSFKIAGERTAAVIRGMLTQAKIRANRVHALVLAWLKTIPDVNEFFLLQESKIKTDQFLKLAEWIAAKLRA